jgi:hypothetical protein
MPTEVFHVEEVFATDRDPDTGAITAQIGDVQNQRVEDNNCPVFQQWGFMSRPATADPASKSGSKVGAEAVALRSVDADIIVGGRDLRSTEIAGQLQPGETCVYAAGGQARLLMKANGSATIYTTADNTETGTSVAVSVAPTGIKIVGAWGAVTMDANGIQMCESGGAFLLMHNNKITLSASEISICGGSVGIGAAPTVPIVGGAGGPTGVGSTTCLVTL